MPPKDTKRKGTVDRSALIEQINIPELTETLFKSSCHGDLTNLTEILTAPTKNTENIRFEAIQYHHLLQVRNDQTRTCLDLASILNHHEIVKLLAERSTVMLTDIINLTNGTGYSCLHLACAWNQFDAIKNIVAAGGDVEQETIHGEKPIDIARRYQHNDLVEYLEWIAIRNKFTRIINDAKDFIVDPSKNLDKLKKDDKKKIEKYTKDALKWFDENQNNSNARELFTNKIKEAEEFLAPFYANVASFLAEMDLNNTTTIRPPSRTPKSGRK
ncbi:unnamed protein product [Adineta steineri]|uniref:Uncharacterized protein n=1 Tax=Adineta steineri TaxID=433720 RepID=A0A813N222_9BILA|nr:unnamed protein product [Adineta steineri]CAF3503740.1 unnamed protein product [Adineta steineri]